MNAAELRALADLICTMRQWDPPTTRRELHVLADAGLNDGELINISTTIARTPNTSPTTLSVRGPELAAKARQDATRTRSAYRPAPMDPNATCAVCGRDEATCQTSAGNTGDNHDHDFQSVTDARRARRQPAHTS